MALFMIICRATGRKVSTGMRLSGSTWNSGAEFYAYTRCPAYESYHEWSAENVSDEVEVTDFGAVASKSQHFHEIGGVVRFRGNDLWKTSGFAGAHDRSSIHSKRSLVNVRL